MSNRSILGALAAFARSSPDVQAVIAHTRPEANASTRVLEKAGFERIGDFTDPEDGAVWRWQLRSDASGSIIHG